MMQMICQPVIFKKAKKVDEDFEQAGMRETRIWTCMRDFMRPIWPIYGRNRFVHGFVGKMKEK